MESRNGEVPSPLQVVTNINETSLLATARKERNYGARHAVSSTRGKALSHCASHNAKP
jgi:hypothetical protein